MTETQAEQTALFDFMVVRAPDEVAVRRLRRAYIEDWGMAAPATYATAGVGPAGLVTVSRITALVARQVGLWTGDPGNPAALEALRAAILADAAALGMVRRAGFGAPPGPALPPLTLGELEAGAYLVDASGAYLLLPDRFERLQPRELFDALARAAGVLTRAALAPTSKPLDRTLLLEQLTDALGRSVVDFVLPPGNDESRWVIVHRAAFDALYLLYVARRWTTVNLDPVIAVLRALHALLAMATDALVASAVGRPNLPEDHLRRLSLLATVWPELAAWKRTALPPGFPLITSRVDLDGFLTAQPVIHPLFGRLFWYGRPFNDVKPIGIGDLKVVRQWLTAYWPGEISHIHNVLKGEKRSRDHRRLEKTEEVFSFTDSRTEDTTQDHQSTERFEVKTEAENVLRTALNVNASANSTLSYGNESTPVRVTASVGLGFAYNRASEDHRKTATTFAKDVVDKAVSRVESRTASTRSTTKLFETEEKNHQEFDNVTGKGHVSGMYRWVDKEYTAQLFNYGKRLMFEFTVPEPAAFWIESRLRGFEAELDVPQPPDVPPYGKVELDLSSKDITPEKFKELEKKYDLSSVPPRPQGRMVTLVNSQDGAAVFQEKGLNAKGDWYTKGYSVTVPNAKGYLVTGVRLAGKVEFKTFPPVKATSEYHLVQLFIGGSPITAMHDWSSSSSHNYWPELRHEAAAVPLEGDQLVLGLGLQDIDGYHLMVDLELTPGDTLAAWQTEVLEVVRDAERKRVEAANQKLELAYESELVEYRNRLSQLDAVTVASILQGGSEAANRQIIDEELKKHCLTLVTREFDTQTADDVLSTRSAIGGRTVKATSTRFTVTKKGKNEPITKAGFTHPDPVEVCYPAIDISESRSKGRVVQFLEQAFEWERLSYVFYPYFWSQQGRWIELANRADLTDPTFTAFLRAGMVRVLVAATPGYEKAVLHFLATREPWDGGPSPVLGDPLFVPLYEEIRQQQDQRLGGTPEGEPWTFTVPTSLVYLHESSPPLPDLAAERRARAAKAPATSKTQPNGVVVKQ